MDELDDLFKDDNLESTILENQDLQIIDNEDDPFGFLEEVKPQESLVETLLKTKGITDGKVTIIDDNEVEQQISFYDLTPAEQLEILGSAEPQETYDLDDNEINLINQLRENNLSVEEFLKQYKDEILAEVGTVPEASYDIDAYDDNELYLLDLKNKYDLTDEELVAELEKELANPEVFAKKTAKLRVDYKQLEDEYKANQQQELQRQKEAEYDQYAQTIVDTAIQTPDFHGITLDDNEKNETLSYLLELDDKGISKFYKELKNPQRLYEAAWYMRYGKEAFDALKDAYENEITKLKKTDKPRVVVQNATKKETIYDLH